MLKSRSNIALKVAIIESGKQQKRIAKIARIPEPQLSHYVRGSRVPSEEEQKRLAKAIGRPVHDLFPTEAA